MGKKEKQRKSVKKRKNERMGYLSQEKGYEI